MKEIIITLTIQYVFVIVTYTICYIKEIKFCFCEEYFIISETIKCLVTALM